MLTTIISHDWEVLVLIPSLGVVTYLSYRAAKVHNIQSSVTILLAAIALVLAILGTNGQGVHDISIMTYSCVIVLGSLVLRMRYQLLIGGLILLAVSWLALGEQLGWYTPEPTAQGQLSDLFVILIVLALSVIISFLLFEKLRRVLFQAEDEIKKRLKISNSLTRELKQKTKLSAQVHAQVQDSLLTLRGLFALEETDVVYSVNKKIRVIERLHRFSKGNRTNVHNYFEEVGKEDGHYIEMDISESVMISLDRVLPLFLYSDEVFALNEGKELRIAIIESEKNWVCSFECADISIPNSTLSGIMVRQLHASVEPANDKVELLFSKSTKKKK